ncbi:FadR/GntR family transcriptional regulator [Gulosibacter hominis]|uniref:FadR/GntR family transcriptional regulator n=1 Tax=Gulosibacter hominis TaxID=2770504 RepID=UPI0030B8366C
MSMQQENRAGEDWHPLRLPPLTARIREEIIRRIETNHLEPGDRIPAERQLAESLGVSRPSVREAIRSLASEGRVRVEHGRGVFVTDPQIAANELRRSVIETLHSLDELFAMREVLEVPAARWAAEAADARLLERVSCKHDQLLEESLKPNPDFDVIQRLDMDFHLSIVRAAGNRFLEQTLGVLNSILREGMRSTLMYPGRLDTSRVEHRNIIDALLAGDGEAAAEAARLHIHAARDIALSPDFQRRRSE